MKLRREPRLASAQRGVVLLFSLIALVVLLIAAVALMRSFNTSLFMSGNIAFKRDLQNQGERAIDQVLADFRGSGDLATAAARSNNLQRKNYSAKALTSNAQGIPEALQTNSLGAAGLAANDIEIPDQAIKIRYVVDRMCNDVGSETALGGANCLLAESLTGPGGNFAEWMNATGASLCPAGSGCGSAAPQGVVYRVTVRVSGPRNTQAFFQSTFTVPS